MFAIEIIALIFSIAIIVKIAYLTFAPAKWMKMTEKIFKHANLLTWVYATITVILGYFIFQVFTIVHIAAITTFIAFLIAVGILPHAKELVQSHKKLTKGKNIWEKYWLSLIIWLLFALWTLKELLF